MNRLFILDRNKWNYVQKKKWAQACLKGYLQNVFRNHVYLIYMYKKNLALNNCYGTYLLNIYRLYLTLSEIITKLPDSTGRTFLTVV